MAKLESTFQFTGKLGGFSAYKMRGVDGIVLRKSGGPTRDQIKNSPAFEGLRSRNDEFGGRSAMAKAIIDSLHPLKLVADCNISGPLTARLQPVQERDATSVFGQRSVTLSEHHQLLEGFSFNRKHPLELFLLSPVKVGFAKETLTARVVLPELIPNVTFRNFEQYPYYRFTIALGAVPDLSFTLYGYKPFESHLKHSGNYICTDWLPSRSTSPQQSLSVTLPESVRTNSMTYIAGVGLCFGVIKDGGVKPTRFGAAKVMLTV